MKPEEVAPPFESWESHLKALSNNDLLELAREYRWLDTEARAREEGEEFRRRRGAIIAECEHRDLPKSNSAKP